MKRLAIIGAGDLGYQIAYHAITDKQHQPVGFFDDFKGRNIEVFGLPILGSINDVLVEFKAGIFDLIMIGIGYKHFDLRAELFDRFYGLIPFGSIVHSSSFVDKSCVIESGVFIYPGCTLDMNVSICHNVVINAGCVIAHDSKVGRHSFLSPSVNIAGFVEIGQKVNLGIGTTVIDNIIIGEYVRTGGGAVVTKNIELPGLYVGVPASFKKP